MFFIRFKDCCKRSIAINIVSLLEKNGQSLITILLILSLFTSTYNCCTTNIVYILTVRSNPAELLMETSYRQALSELLPYAKKLAHRKSQRDLLTSDFENAFHDVNLDDIPPAEELDAIWAYMNYHLNFNTYLVLSFKP